MSKIKTYLEQLRFNELMQPHLEQSLVLYNGAVYTQQAFKAATLAVNSPVSSPIAPACAANLFSTVITLEDVLDGSAVIIAAISADNGGKYAN